MSLLYSSGYDMRVCFSRFSNGSLPNFSCHINDTFNEVVSYLSEEFEVNVEYTRDQFYHHCCLPL